jgi:hypothetical protein
MKNLLIALALVTGLTAGQAIANEPGECLTPNAPKTSQILKQNGQVTQQVLCCCRTSNGGQCCGYVSFCSTFVPGCFCSANSKPEVNENNDSTVNGDLKRSS